ncbi:MULTISPECIES: coiled-coil domain-containing protein [Proteus]|uniref:coiled-coil domain-containing protein n=2 Tax=Morganellaceae TaxID=1903414 RepID=UPI000503EFCD|nr:MULTISPECIES: hypothetical protein [Proteus]RNT24256.1 hypothetical protein B9475_016125 [Proteus mirabilis]KGA57305.1 hypothetical protein DR95_2480 [Proteus vulgaris]MBW3473082.1 hypothetical protein [Proteus vulgaris]MDM3560922.1 hypothetical protein [Proteus vulgaris]MDM3564366.1 hypothetical protein [Proteus vulgaris]
MPTFIDSHRSFLLSITDINDKTDRKSIEFDKNSISLFLKKGNDDVFIANKDKKFLLSNIKKELDNSIDKYTNHGENKNRIEKLKKRINLGGVKFFFDNKDKIISVKNINDIGDVRKIFDGLLSYKKEESVCTKVRKSIYNTNSFEGVVFNDKNPIINSFINHKVKLSSSKNNNVGFYGCNMSIMKMEEEIKEIQDEIKEIQDEIKEIQDEIKLLENELSSKIRINNKKIIDTTLAINKLVDLLEYNDLSKINVDILIAKEEEFNNEVIIVSRLNLMEKIDGVDKLKELKSSLEKIKCIKNKYFIFVESVNGRQISLLRSLDNKLKKYTAGINSEIPKENILLDINKIASVLFINNNDRENYNGFFSKIYKILFPKSYQKRLDINNKAHGNIMLMHENLNVILNSDNFKDGKLPEWANKLITKTLKESKPKNDILWLFSKERKEWNKIFNMLIVK